MADLDLDAIEAHHPDEPGINPFVRPLVAALREARADREDLLRAGIIWRQRHDRLADLVSEWDESPEDAERILRELCAADEADGAAVDAANVYEAEIDRAMLAVSRAHAEVKRADGQRDDARAAIAAVRALCEQRIAEHADYVRRIQDGTLITLDRFIGPAQVNVADVLAAMDVRHDPSATTDGGEAAEALLGIVLAVAFAALLLWRLTS